MVLARIKYSDSLLERIKNIENLDICSCCESGGKFLEIDLSYGGVTAHVDYTMELNVHLFTDSIEFYGFVDDLVTSVEMIKRGKKYDDKIQDLINSIELLDRTENFSKLTNTIDKLKSENKALHKEIAELEAMIFGDENKIVKIHK